MDAGPAYLGAECGSPCRPYPSDRLLPSLVPQPPALRAHGKHIMRNVEGGRQSVWFLRLRGMGYLQLLDLSSQSLYLISLPNSEKPEVDFSLPHCQQN